MTIEYTGDDGKTEICVRLDDIVAFTHQAGTDIFTIIIAKDQMSWVSVSEDCFNFIKDHWVEWAND